MPYNKLSNKFLNDLWECFFKQAMSAMSPKMGLVVDEELGGKWGSLSQRREPF